MSYRFFASVCVLAWFGATPLITSAADQSKAVSNTWKVPRTPDGQPDLQGVWTTSTLTPLERPPELAGKEFLTEKEAEEFAKRTFAQSTGDRRDGTAEEDVGRSYNEFWRDRGDKVIGSRRTSLIVDPPNGRIPPLTPEAQKRMADARARTRLHPADGPEDRSVQERCLGRGVPIVPMNYNNNYQIVQAPGYFMILHEMNHDARIVPLDGRPHVSQNIREWFGDARGHWEGDTLVVESTNFSEKADFRGSSSGLRLVERFTRTGPDTINYGFTIDDPAAFTRAWSAQLPMRKSDGLLYEYACHEGNYALADILSGARAEEKKAAAEKPSGK
jgi:hypothetical protein